MANVKVTQDKNGVRWLELMRNGSGTLLEIRDKDEALQIISVLQHRVQLTASGVGWLSRFGYRVIGWGCRLVQFGGN